ncbi:MAG: ergothioneine biosynthesis protein EgtB [Bradyrhizobium sp.]|nr:ergothioneine biosynthesis protein EgtB [Bradyrhizobium sp.]
MFPGNSSADATFSTLEIIVTTQASAAATPAAPSASLFSDSGSPAHDLVEAYLAVRNETERRAGPLSPEDQLIQSMPDASPAKWHRAHTTWFFEQFLLGEHCGDYKPYHPDYAYLFNSYYVSAGPRHARHQRGHLTRPAADEITAYRRHVDAAVVKFFRECSADTRAHLEPLVEVGLNHEQQHQELMLTDILHAFAQNPIAPAYDPAWKPPAATRTGSAWIALKEGIHTVGHTDHTFHFDNEKPAHRALIGPVWSAPGYWRQIDGQWHVMTLAGLKPVDPAAPVCHISYYEADAFARWSGKHLPTEMEWEVAARAGHLNDAFGIVWQWTRSAYGPYPGYRAIDGALGEYNGKFMVNQLVLRGSSLATPGGHSRLTYRNFFYPHHRWQFTGLRLADYAT